MKSMFWLILIAALPLGAKEPAWLAEARMREAEEMKLISLQSDDRKFHATVAAKLRTTKIEAVEGSYTLTFDIGGPSALDCELYLDDIDAATHLRAVPPHIFSYIEQSQGKIERTVLESIDAGVLGEWPFLAASWFYRVNDGNQIRLAALQQVVAERNDVSISCQFLAIGYSKTIRRVMTSLLDGLELAEPRPQPYYTETGVVEVDGKPVGLAKTEMMRDSDGDTRINSELAMLAVLPDGNLNSQDVMNIQWVGPDADLINAVHVQIGNGAVNSELYLKMQDGVWKVSGTAKGEDIAAEISGDQKPETILGQAHALRQLLSGKDAVGGQRESLRWSPSENPLIFLKKTTTVSEELGDGQFAVREVMAETNVNFVVDAETGSAVSGVFRVGAAEINLRRVHQSGDF